MNLRRISNWLFNLDAHYPRTIIAGVIFITVILGWKVFNLELDPSVRSMLPRDHSIVESIEKIDDGSFRVTPFPITSRRLFF